LNSETAGNKILGSFLNNNAYYPCRIIPVT
jgi:hypothetical protein